MPPKKDGVDAPFTEANTGANPTVELSPEDYANNRLNQERESEADLGGVEPAPVPSKPRGEDVNLLAEVERLRRELDEARRAVPAAAVVEPTIADAALATVKEMYGARVSEALGVEFRRFEANRPYDEKSEAAKLECREVVNRVVAQAITKVRKCRDAGFDPRAILVLQEIETKSWDGQSPYNLFIDKIPIPGKLDADGDPAVRKVVNLDRLRELEVKMRVARNNIAAAQVVRLIELVDRNRPHLEGGGLAVVKTNPLPSDSSVERQKKEEFREMTRIINGKYAEYDAAGKVLKVRQDEEGLLGHAAEYNKGLLNRAEIACLTAFGSHLSGGRQDLGGAIRCVIDHDGAPLRKFTEESLQVRRPASGVGGGGARPLKGGRVR